MIPSGLLAFGLEPAPEAFLLLEQIQGQVSQNGKVLCSISFADATIIFTESDV
jgi:hypothetical protein